MKGVIGTFLMLALYVSFCKGNTSESKVEQSLQDSKNTLAKLYATIRSVAQPPVSETASGEDVINSRLVLLLPGKVLNYYDYFPGDRYEASLEDPHHDGQQVPIPPKVMENMFQLADVIPGVYPLGGAETGESMAIIYENILNQLEVKGFNEKTQAQKERYVKAIGYLAEEIADPLDVTVNVTRFGLYRRSQDLYNTERLKMENDIAEKRSSLPAIEFEHWFQRNYPSLNSRVEGAYTEWLIFGQKEIVELYKSYLDVESPGIALEEARMALRASGLSSLDRTRTIYPVTFAPSNWYRYLTNVSAVDDAQQARVREKESLTRDEIQARIGELEAKKQVLKALQQASGSSESLKTELANLLKKLTSSNQNLTMFAEKTERLRQDCLVSRIQAKSLGENNPSQTEACQNYELNTGNASDEIIGNSDLYACVRDLDFQVNGVNNTIEAFQAVVDEIDENIEDLQSYLLRAGSKFPSLARHAADSQDQLDSRWLQFEFDSSNEVRETESSRKHTSVATAFKASGLFWSVQGSFSYSRSESSFRAAMNSAKVKVKGEILRVVVQRPWFRPSLFKSTQFQIRTDPKLRVSPGELSEMEFVKTIQPGNEQKYILPQYVTGLLMSRNIELDFDTEELEYSTRAVRESYSASLSGGFGPWSASFSFNHGRSHSTTRMETTATGLRVSIPGAQVIGYYTQVVPKFPPPPDQ